MGGPATLLVIGIHREELAFGTAVAAGLDPRQVEVLAIPDGLSGRRPRPDQRFQYDTLHRALYRQLLSYVRPHHRLLLDLHTGTDPDGLCADIYCRDIGRLKGILAGLTLPGPAPRLFALGQGGEGESAETVIPDEIWCNPAFLYVGLEVYLPQAGAGRDIDQAYGRALVGALCAALAADLSVAPTVLP